MQRLLRSRWFYVLLVLFSAGLHWHALQRDEAAPLPALPRAESVEDATAWWPKQLDAVTLRHVAAEHPRAMAALSALTMLLGLMAFGGLVLGVRDVGSGRARRAWRRKGHRLPSWSFGEIGRIVVLMAAIVSLMPFVRMALQMWLPAHELDPHLWISGSMVFLDLLLALMIATLALGKRAPLRDALGCPRARTGPGLGEAARAYLVTFPWLFLILMVTVRLAQWLNFHPPVEPIHELVFHESSPLTLGLTVALACAVGPVAEELFFRGVLYGALRTRLPWAAAIGVSALLFSLIHTNVLGLVPILVLGALLAYVYEQTGSLLPAIAIHVAHNTLLMALALSFRHLGLAG